MNKLNININGAIISDDDKWIYDYFEMSSACPRDIEKAIITANGEPLEVYINSGGGSIFAGSEIYSRLRDYSGNVNIHITGLAASAASVIACASHCDISPTGMIMIHNVSSYASGDYNTMQKESEILKLCNESICNAYVLKTGMDKNTLLELMNKETWLTAEQAVDMKFVDSITSPKTNISASNFVASCADIIPQAIINQIRHKKIAARAQAKLNLIKITGGIKL